MLPGLQESGACSGEHLHELLEIAFPAPSRRRHTAGQWYQCSVCAPAHRCEAQRACCLLLLGAYFAGRLLAAGSYWLQVTQQRPSSTMGGHRSVAGGLLGHSTSRLFLELASANPMVFAQHSLLLGSDSFLVPAVLRSPALSRLFLHKQCPSFLSCQSDSNLYHTSEKVTNGHLDVCSVFAMLLCVA